MSVRPATDRLAQTIAAFLAGAGALAAIMLAATPVVFA